jgi:hypothetical protein
MPANDAGRTICNKGVILVWWSQRKYYNLCLYKNLDIILFSFVVLPWSLHSTITSTIFSPFLSSSFFIYPFSHSLFLLFLRCARFWSINELTTTCNHAFFNTISINTVSGRPLLVVPSLYLSLLYSLSFSLLYKRVHFNVIRGFILNKYLARRTS